CEFGADWPRLSIPAFAGHAASTSLWGSCAAIPGGTRPRKGRYRQPRPIRADPLRLQKLGQPSPRSVDVRAAVAKRLEHRDELVEMLGVKLPGPDAERLPVGRGEDRERQRVELDAEARRGVHAFGLADENRVIEAHLLGERLDLRHVVDRDPDDRKPRMLVLERFQHRDLTKTRGA